MSRVDLTNGNDIYVGNEFGNIVYGHAGDDILYGRGGNDVIFGGDGNDQLEGNEGNDFLYGGTGNDVAIGGSGNDLLTGQSGNDILYTHGSLVGDFINEMDDLYGGVGSDSFYIMSDYLGGASSTNPNTDSSHVRIWDYSAREDGLISLKYDPSTYVVSSSGNFLGGGAADTRVWYVHNGVPSLVAVIVDSSLNRSNFVKY